MLYHLNLPTRRTVLGVLAAAVQAIPQITDSGIPAEVIRRHDEHVERLLGMQVTDPQSRWRGGYPDADGLHHGGSGSGLLGAFCTAIAQPRSKHYRSGALTERIRLAADFMTRQQTPDGNYNLLITNFNSPPDTAFIMENMASAAFHVRKDGQADVEELLEPIIRKAAAALVRGGIHTPNHRWVVCAALAQINELYPDTAYARRIDEWLAEGIDIDPDGQYTERSTVVYNGVTNRALTIVAAKLNRPHLLDPVRKNLDSMIYLLHPGGEVVTEISRRQDLNTRGTIASSWFALKYLAVKDRNGTYETLARQFPGSLSDWMEYPEMRGPAPAPKAVPEDYEKHYPFLGVARIRRGLTSATVLLGDNSRIFALRHGDAVINAVRVASAFFGKAQFVPDRAEKRGDSYVFTQYLEGPYYQPLDPPRTVGTEEWAEVRRLRRQTEVCKLNYEAILTERRDGFQFRMKAHGTDDVPLAIEVNLREGGKLEGCEPAPRVEDGWILPTGHAIYRLGDHFVRFGPGRKENTYTQVRGALPKLSGPSVYLTGYTPFDHTLEFTWS
jgi:hypothetical protein